MNICKYEHDIRIEAKRNKLDPELLAALIFVESSYYPHVVSKAGACGLTQVVPRWTGGKETGRIKYSCQQLKNPRTAIKVGAQILSYNIWVYAKGNTNKGLCYYNAGTKCITSETFYKKLYYVKLVNKIKKLLEINKS